MTRLANRKSIIDRVARAAVNGNGQHPTNEAPEKPAPKQPPNPPGKKVRTVDPYQPFPVDALPAIVSSYVSQGSIALGCDPAFLALPMLSVTASLIGNRRAIQLKRGWQEPVIIWTTIVGESGSLKTPAFQKAVAHLYRLQKRLREEHRQCMSRYLDDVQTHKEAKKKAKESGQDPGDPPEEPKQRRVICSDTTIEKLAEILEDNPEGTLVARDELAGWLGSFTRYKSGGGSDLPNWLEMFRAGTIVIDRKTGERRNLFVPRACVCVTGGIQPGVLTRSLTSEFLDAGLAARLLLAMPPRMTKTWSEVEVAPETEQAYQHLLDRLLDLDFADRDGERGPHVLTLSPEAKQVWVAFYNEWAREQAAAEGELAAALSKLEGYTARFALLHHIVSHIYVDSDDRRSVGLKSIEAGITLTRWFANEARRIYQMLTEDDEERDTRRLVEFVRARGGRITVKQLQRSNSRKYPTAESAKAALEALVGANLGRWVQGPIPERGGHRPSYLELLPTTDFSDHRPEEGDDLSDGDSDSRADCRFLTPEFSGENGQGSEKSVVGQENGEIEILPENGPSQNQESEPRVGAEPPDRGDAWEGDYR